MGLTRGQGVSIAGAQFFNRFLARLRMLANLIAHDVACAENGPVTQGCASAHLSSWFLDYRSQPLAKLMRRKPVVRSLVRLRPGELHYGRSHGGQDVSRLEISRQPPEIPSVSDGKEAKKRKFRPTAT